MPAIFVLGMHRSGTSCLTGVLQACGVYLGEVSTRNPNNLRGNRENRRVNALNESLLQLNGGSWRQPVFISNWSPEHALLRDELVTELSDIAGRNWWAIKDPRLLFTLPFWLDAIQPRFIGTFRHPVSVARSLAGRQSQPLSFDQGIALWQKYNTNLLALHEQSPFPLVNFDLPSTEYVMNVISCLSAIGVSKISQEHVHAFFADELRSQKPLSSEQFLIPKTVKKVHESISILYRSPQYSTKK